MKTIKETGQASIIISLEGGNITVRHGTEGNNAILLVKENVANGSWDKIWETLNKLQQDGECEHDSTHMTHDGSFCADCGIKL